MRLQHHSITIGNTAKPLSSRDLWEWRMFVDLKGLPAEAVSIKLHPTFQRRIHQLSVDETSKIYQSPPFVGWGRFEVEVGVRLSQQDKVLQFVHCLDFSDGGAQDDHILEIEEEDIASSRDPRLGLQQRPYLSHTDEMFWHGRVFDLDGPLPGCLLPPTRSWASQEKPRDDHDAPDWLTASEYQDVTCVLDAKVQALAQLLRASCKTVIYSGAGISVAAGIGQAARGGRKKSHPIFGVTKNKTTTATPTFTHFALAALAQQGLIHGWVQQNHDGLPQKAGFPQERINEIHGSWYDPSNPVVVYSGQLRDHEHDWMVDDAESADLALVLGTSLGGLNADQVAIKTAKRSLRGKALGMVMINLQQTEHDGKSSLRIFAETDNVFSKLLQELHLPAPNLQPAIFSQQESRVLAPYDKHGERSNSRRMWLDLRPGAAIMLTPHHNVRGAGQPAYRHMAKTKQPKGTVLRWRDSTVGIDLEIQGTGMSLGQWWIEAAARGGPATIPIVNVHPEFEGYASL